MKEALPVIFVLAIFVFGYFLIKRLDAFLNDKRISVESVSETEEPCCIMLDLTLSDEEIADEIRKFRQKHKNATIYLCDNANSDKQ